MRSAAGNAILAWACIAAALAGARATANPPPIEAFGNAPVVSSVDINPAGTLLAWIDHTVPTGRVKVFDIAGRRELTVRTNREYYLLRELGWADDATLLMRVIFRYRVDRKFGDIRETHRWIGVPVVIGQSNELPLIEESGWSVRAAIVRRRTRGTGRLFFATRPASTRRSSTRESLDDPYVVFDIGQPAASRVDFAETNNLYGIDVRTGQGTLVESGTIQTSTWTIDSTGKHRVRTDEGAHGDDFTIEIKDGDKWRSLYESTQCGELQAIGFSSSNTALLALGRRCNDTRAKLWSIPLNGAPASPMLEDAGADAESAIMDPLDDTPLGVVFAGATRSTQWLDETAAGRIGELRRALGIDQITIVGRSADNQRLVVRAEDARHPPVFHLVDYSEKRVDIIHEAYPHLSGTRLGSFRVVNYRGRDGYPLVAYLTLPPDRSETDLPMVVLAHEGPDTHDGDRFDWMAQFLATRGYAVLQPQFRGSTGFGLAHRDAGKHQWGLRMQDDITDAVRHAILEGVANPNKVCIVGKGYGGYAALAGAAFTPGMYSCAISVAGISSLPLMARRAEWWREQIGSPTDPDVMARSPSRSASTFAAPVLLLHGTEDSVVPIQHSRTMANALKRAGKRHEFIELEGEDHWLSNNSTRIRVLQEIERFLARNLAQAH